MAFKIPKRSLNVEQAKQLASECYVVEKLSYMQKKNYAKPKTVRFFASDDDHFIIPYFTALRHGFYHQSHPWRCIQPITLNEGHGLPTIDETSPYYRPFGVTFRDYQQEPMQEIMNYLDQYYTVTIAVYPGWGKTLAGMYLSIRLGLVTCIMMSLKSVLKGWATTSKMFPGFKIWVVGGGKPCPEDVDIILCMDGRFEQIPEHIVTQIGTLIIDEVHLLCTPTRADIFLKFFPKYVILESATPEKANDFHYMAHLMAGTHGVYKLLDRPHNVYIVYTGLTGEYKKGKNGIIASSLRQDLVSNSFRQDIMLYILMKICQQNKIMCIRMVKESIETFVSKVKAAGITCDCMYEHKDDFMNSQVLVGTQQKMGVGMDEANVCVNFDDNPIKSNVVIFENTTPSPTVYEQARNRARDMTDIIILCDNNSSCTNHIREITPHIKKTNGTIIKLNYWELVFRERPQIYQLPTQSEIFYRVCTHDEYTLFLEYKILDRNEYDEINGGYEIFRDPNLMLSKHSSGIVLELINLVIASRELEGVTEYICTCPICDYHIARVSTL